MHMHWCRNVGSTFSLSESAISKLASKIANACQMGDNSHLSSPDDIIDNKAQPKRGKTRAKKERHDIRIATTGSTRSNRIICLYLKDLRLENLLVVRLFENYLKGRKKKKTRFVTVFQPEFQIFWDSSREPSKHYLVHNCEQNDGQVFHYHIFSFKVDTRRVFTLQLVERSLPDCDRVHPIEHDEATLSWRTTATKD